MTCRLAGAVMVAAGLMAVTPAMAAKSNCGPDGPPCGTIGKTKDTNILPGDNQFALRGDLFTRTFTDLVLRDGSAPVDLGFSIRVGFGPVSTLFVNQNGIVSFGAPLSPATVPAVNGGAGLRALATGPVRNLSDIGVPVIAPYFAPLTPGAGSGDGALQLGDITVQYGLADPYADGGAYKESDQRKAVRITWYGLTVPGASTVSRNVFAQLLISADDAGLSSFEFRYGPPDTGRAYQPDYGSLAGFALGDTQVQFRGPYADGVPTFFEFLDDEYIGQFGTRIDAAVPEPATWAQLIAGFGLLGYTLRRRRAWVAVIA